MKIKTILTQHRNDFTATMECEHCGHEQHLSYGYNDGYYHNSVIPGMFCKGCGKARAGSVQTTNEEPQ